MTTPLDALLAAREQIDAAIASLGGESTSVPATGGLDDPLTAPLTVDGLWVPPLLSRLTAATRRKFPEGYTEPRSDLLGNFRRVPVVYPRALVLQKCASRGDLTEDQRRMILFARDAAWFQGTFVDGGSEFNFRQLDFPVTGGFLAACATVYDDNLPRLERDLRRWFWTRWQVEVDGDKGGL